ncbi:LamG domain-containing protein [Patescibacteria group bacterium]|nr:LamG domain-containing protein [Patescibacteria group bacterium]
MLKIFKKIKHQLFKFTLRLKRKIRFINWHKFKLPGLILLGLALIGLIVFWINNLPAKAPNFKKSSSKIYSFEAKNKIFRSGIGIKDQAPLVSFGVSDKQNITFSYQVDEESNPQLDAQGKNLTFSEIEKGVDLRYQTLANGLKEEIILHQARQKENDANIFVFDANFQGIQTKELLKGMESPVFYNDKGEYLFHFEKPFAIDAAGNRSDDVLLQIEDKAGSKVPEIRISFEEAAPYSVRLIVNEEWLNDPARVYPITIDPTIVHDTSSEFASGQFNRVKDTGSGTSPVLESYYQELSADPHTVGLWHMNEASGDVLDSSGNSNTGTPTGTTVVDGLLGNARSFNGSSDYIAMSNQTVNEDVTVEAWFKTTGSTAVSSIASHGTTWSSYDIDWNLYVTAVGLVVFDVYRFTTSSGTDVASNNAYNDGNWHHVAGIINENTAYLYVDGVLQNQQTVANYVANTKLLQIGVRPGLSSYFFDGTLDEVKISGIARSAEEIKAAASRRPYSVYTSDVIDLNAVYSWNSLSWTKFGVGTGDGETPADNSDLLTQWNFNESNGTSAVSGGICGTSCNGTLTDFGDTSSTTLANGGSVSYADGYTIHTFTSSGTFTPSQSITPEVLVVGGGGGGGATYGGGGGGGGVVYNSSYSISAAPISVTVGGGGAIETNGGNSVFDSITAYGGGHGGSSNSCAVIVAAASGGSGGGGGYSGAGASGTAGQGNSGGAGIGCSSPYTGGGGGGASGAGANGNSGSGGNGGAGVANSISGTSIYYGGGGGGNGYYATGGSGGLGFGQNGGGNEASLVGGGGGGAATGATLGAGGNGTVIIRYPTPTVIATENTGWTFNNSRWGGGALMFDGYNDYINVGDINAIDSLTAFTACAWVNHRTLSDDDAIINKVNPSDGWAGIMFNRDDVGQNSGRTDTYKIHVNQSLSTTAAEIEGASNASKAGVWTQVCATFKANDATGLRLYVNGVEDPNSPASTVGITSIDSGSNPLNIGRYAPTTANFFSGIMDVVQIYSRTLTATEILSNYNVGNIEIQTRVGDDASPDDNSWEAWSPITTEALIESLDGDSSNWDWDNISSYVPKNKADDTTTKIEGLGSLKLQLGSAQTNADTVGLWHFEETDGTGAYIKDSSINANHGTPTGTESINGISGKGRSFNGSSYITVADSNSLDLTGNFSISAWVNRKGGGGGTVVSKTVAGTTGGYAVLWGSAGEIYCRTNNGTTYTDSYSSQGVLTSTTGWTHVVAVKNGTSCRIYINGIDKTSVANSHTNPIANTLPLLIGSRSDLGAEFTIGLIDEIRISNVANSAEEIAENYRMGRDHYLSTSLSTTDLSNKISLPFYIAADRPGTYLETTIGESAFANYQPDANTAGLWHLNEDGFSKIKTPPAPKIFSYTGSAQSYVVPEGVTSITVKSWGAGGGGGGGSGNSGGGGGYATSTISVTPGETITIDVGGGGGAGWCGAGTGGGAAGGGAYGIGGRGGNAGTVGSSCGGGGGGAGSYVLQGSTVLAGAAGGGGGGGAESGGGAGAGGGGGVNGSAGSCSSVGGVTGASGTVNGVQAPDRGGADASAGGGGGGGYTRGGTGGTYPTCDSYGAGGGAGGSNYGTTTNNGSGTTPGNSSDVDRAGVYGNGGGTGGGGTNGRIVVYPNFPTDETIRDSSGNNNSGFLDVGNKGTVLSSTTFSYTGSAQSYVVPNNIYSIQIKAWGGGGGGGGQAGAAGGGGGYSNSVIPVFPGETLTVYTGGGGGGGWGCVTGTGGGAGGGGGYGNGGRGGYAGTAGCSAGGGGGGGGSFVLRGSTVLLVAGGGGGGAGAESGGAGAGGGGGANGANGSCSSVGGVPHRSTSASGNSGGDKGGADGSGGGGAGGGYNGSSGGGAPGCDSTGGAGGGGGKSLGLTTINGSGTTPGNSSDTDRAGLAGGGGTTAAGANGIVLISATTNAPTQGKIGKARMFNGDNDYVTIPDSSSLDITGPLTVSSWVKLNGTNTTNHGGINKYANNTTYSAQRSYGFVFAANATNPIVYLSADGSTPLGFASSTNISQEEWHHIAFTYEPSTSVKIYIDGKLDLNSTTDVPASLFNSSAPLWIGTNYDNTDSTRFSNSLYDEVRIDSVVRSAEEIRQAYEIGLRSHQITIDFAASLDSTNLIMNSSDTSFIIDATTYGLAQKGFALYKGETIVVRENYDGTEYIAQGVVTNVNIATGEVTVDSWSASSTIPGIGFTEKADVFKWQREYWPINELTLPSQLNSISNLTLRLTDGAEGRTVWLDDLRSNGGYLNDSSDSTVTSAVDHKYFQYRAILTSTDETVSPSLSTMSLDYISNFPPAIPSLDSPADGAINLSLTPVLKTTTTDIEDNYILYKITICKDVSMSTDCQTLDQTVSQTGWSGQNTQSNTAYTSGTQATYTLQANLEPNTTYYWKSLATDPVGSLIWGETQTTPHSFTTSANPNAPTDPYAEGVSNPLIITDLTPEFSAIHNDSNGDNAVYYEIEVNTASDFTGTVMWDSGKQSMTPTANGARSPNISYAGTGLVFNGSVFYWRIRFWDIFDLISPWSTTQNFSLNTIPNVPTLDSPVDGNTSTAFKPILKTTAEDIDSDYLRYKIQVCTDVVMTVHCQTFDQTSSQTGWSGQNTQTNTAYTSGTQATYTLQTGLEPNTTYYWRSYAIDPGGSNTWSATQTTPRSFTTLITPLPASSCFIQESISDNQLLIVWTDNAENEDFYEVQRSVDGGAWTALETGLAPNTANLLDNTISNGHTYQYRIAPYFIGPYYASWCVANTLNLGLGLFNLEGIRAEGLHFD